MRIVIIYHAHNFRSLMPTYEHVATVGRCSLSLEKEALGWV